VKKLAKRTPKRSGKTEPAPIEQPVRRQNDVRRRTRSEIGIETGSGEWRMFPLVDLSEHGCSLDSVDWPFRIGQFLSLNLLGSSKIEGIVRWARDHQVGIEFVRPLSTQNVEQMAPQR
jgi:hypothetical protein